VAGPSKIKPYAAFSTMAGNIIAQVSASRSARRQASTRPSRGARVSLKVELQVPTDSKQSFASLKADIQEDGSGCPRRHGSLVMLAAVQEDLALHARGCRSKVGRGP
jgi:hypothetical protein